MAGSSDAEAAEWERRFLGLTNDAASLPENRERNRAIMAIVEAHQHVQLCLVLSQRVA